MKVKRFVANNLQEAILQIKTEMGRDAIILHTKKFKEGGILGFFTQEKVEVTAAVDESAAAQGQVPLALPFAVNRTPVAAAASPIQTPYPASPVIKAATFAPIPTPSPASAVAPTGFGEPAKAVGRPEPITLAGNVALAPAESIPRENVGNVQEDIKEMKQVMHHVLREIGKTPEIPAYPMPLNKIHKTLLKSEVEERLADQMMHQLMNCLPTSEWTNSTEVREMLFKIMQQQLKMPAPIDLSDGGRRVVVLVGPTGVGKTTTLAKLAANYYLIEKRKVGMISIDTYRIAAVEQLRTYAQIIGVPLEVVFNPQLIPEAMNRFADKELILVDTAGRSPKNEQQMEELREFLCYLAPTDVLLAVSATTGITDMWDIYRRFKRLDFNKVVLTKLDEAEVYGPLYNLAVQIEEKLSYVTTGQNVPDDIEVADPKMIINLILQNGGDLQ